MSRARVELVAGRPERSHGGRLDPELSRWLADLRRAGEERRAAEGRAEVLVQRLRGLGVSWAVVGDALGITKQAAAQRYGARRLL